MNRRTFLATAAAVTLLPSTLLRGDEAAVLGQGDFKYRVVPNWHGLTSLTPVKNCHGIVEDKDGNLYILTDHVKNNVIICDAKGKLQNRWTLDLPGAHGLSIVNEGEGKNAKQVLFITDIRVGEVVKTTLDGEVLERWGWPEGTGKYENAKQYRPSWTLHKPDGSFFILDGYGKDYIQHIDAQGKQQALFGGAEGGITHWGPHGGIYDNEGLLIAMSDQQYLMKLNDQGVEQFKVQLPGGNPRQIQRVGDHYFVAHLADNWPKNRDSRGFVSILDKDFKVVANLGGTPPEFGNEGELQQMRSVGEAIMHPHDLCVASDGSLYVAQFMSGATYPIKLERV